MLVPLPSSMSKLDKHILVLGSVSLLQGYCITTLKYQGVCHVKKQNYRSFFIGMCAGNGELCLEHPCVARSGRPAVTGQERLQ